MPISSNSTITNQFVPSFKITDLVNGNILVYSSTDGAFVNTNTLGANIIVGKSNLAPKSVGTVQLDTSNDPVTGYVLGIDVNGDLTYISLINGGAGSLSGLVDTGISLPINTEILRYNGSLWVNDTINMSDVATITTPLNKNVMFYDGVNWINKQLDYADLNNVPSLPTNGDFTFLLLDDTNNTTVNNGFLRWNSNSTQIDYFATISAADITGLATVATSGDYADLINKPSLAIYAQSSSLALVATTGAYASLTGLPFIPSTVNDLSDAIVSSPINGQVLKYNGTNWVNATLVLPQNITDLSDTNITSPSIGEVLKWDGADWVDGFVAYSELTGVPSTFAPAAHTQGAASITDLASWVGSHQSLVSFVGLGDTNNTIVNSGYLKWNSSGTQVDYFAAIPYTDVSGLSTVANTGAYADLTGKPTLATVATSGVYADLTGKPTLVTNLDSLTDTIVISPALNEVLSYNGSNWINIAFDYANLSNKPTLFSGVYADLTGKPSTFTPSAHTHVMADITDLFIPLTLDDLSNVIAPTPTNGQFLKFNGTNWVNSTFSLVSYALNDLGDTTITLPADAEYLRYDGAQWLNSALDYADLINVPSTFAPSAHTHLAANISDLSTWLSSNLATITFTGISQTNNTIVNNGFLRWNAGGTQINYSATISSADITGLSAVATSGDYADLINTPTVPVLLSDLSDVNVLPTPVANNFLRYTGTEWVAANVTYGQVSGTPTNNTYSFVGLNDTDGTIVNDGYLKWNAGGTSIEYVTTIPYTSVSGLATVANTGVYADLTGKPTIPTNNTFSFVGLSDTNNTPVNSGLLRWNAGGTQVDYVTSIPHGYVSGLLAVATTGLYSDLTGTPNLGLYALTSSLAPVALSGDYVDLINTPVLSNYALTSSLATVATSGSYVDLTNKPTIPTNINFTLSGLSDTDNVIINDGYLKWNIGGTSVEYVTTIPYTAISGLSTVANTGVYNDLTGRPNFALYATVASISNVGFSGDYADLILNVPTSASYNFVGLSDTSNTIVNDGYLKWNTGGTSVEYVATIPYTAITGLATVGHTGAYSDLTGLPTLFDGTYTSLTGKPSTFAPSAHTHAWSTDITGKPLIPSLIDDLSDVTITSPTNGQVIKWSSATSKWVNGAYNDIVNLGDVSPTPIANGYLRWNTAANTIIFETEISAINITGLAPVATSGDLGDLGNVSINAPLNGYALLYNSTTQKWESQPNASVDLGIYVINDLGDVVITTPTIGDFLKFDGTNWIDSPIQYSDVVGIPSSASYTFVGLADTNNSALANGFLRWNNTATQINYSTTISYADITGLSTVGHTGVYNDLTGKPTLVTDLDGLTDVTVGPLVDGYVLTYDSIDSQWKGLPAAISVLNLNDIADVIAPSPSVGDSIAWSGSSWVGGKINYTDLNGLPTLFSGAYADLTGKPSTFAPSAHTHVSGDVTGLHAVATSGDYTALVNKPSIPNNASFSFLGLNDTVNTVVNDGYLKWNVGGTAIEYVTAITVSALTDVTDLAAVATAGTLDSLIDVNVSTINDGDTLIYDTGMWIPYTPSNGFIVTNKTIYVATTGDDSTGDGTIGTPYATIQKALSSIEQAHISNDVYVTISVGEGYITPIVYEPLIVDHKYGDRIKIIGATPVNTFSITANTSTTGIYTYTVSTNPTGIVNIGDYVTVSGVTGTGHNFVSGIFPVTGVTASSISVSHNNRNTLIAYTATAGTITLQKTVLGNFITIYGKLGALDNVVINGELRINNGSLLSSNNASIMGGVVVNNSKLLYAINTYITNNNYSDGYGISCINGSFCDVSGYITNTYSSAVYADSHSYVSLPSCVLSGGVTVSGTGGVSSDPLIVADNMSMVNAVSAVYDGYSGTVRHGLYANFSSSIRRSLSDTSGLLDFDALGNSFVSR